MSDDLERRLEDLLDERARVSAATHERTLDSIDRLPDRRKRHIFGPVSIAAAMVVLTVIGLAAAISPRTPPVLAPSPSTTASPQTSLPSASPSPTLQPRPVWAKDLAEHLRCDGPISSIGMDVPASPGPLDPADTPDEALDNILNDYRSLPDSGYTSALIDGHWALHRYLVDARAKVHIVSTNQFPDVPVETRWQVVGLRACDPSEFGRSELGEGGPTIWRDASGDPVRTDIIFSSVGPAHCDWQRTVLLTLGAEHTQYIRDPYHDLADQTVMSFDADAPLPDDAVDTGLRNDEWHLFTIPSGRAVYMRTGAGTYERWPRTRDAIGCA